MVAVPKHAGVPMLTPRRLPFTALLALSLLLPACGQTTPTTGPLPPTESKGDPPRVTKPEPPAPPKDKQPDPGLTTPEKPLPEPEPITILPDDKKRLKSAADKGADVYDAQHSGYEIHIGANSNADAILAEL